MPLESQAFTAKRANWESHLAREGRAGKALAVIFGASEKVTISRRDLRNYAAGSDLDKFAMATILWGYPRGMRGNHVSKIAERFETLVKHLTATARIRSVEDWPAQYREVDELSGVGLSTYTKFLTFLSIKIHSFSALILDERIVRIIGDRIFDELNVLGGKRPHNPQDWYPDYLSCLHELASSFGVSSEAIEFFLFEFGLNLKQPDVRPLEESSCDL
ncbi:MAG: hypothetical protein WAN32_14940 [Candidatus Acidiferrum sp.]